MCTIVSIVKHLGKNELLEKQASYSISLRMRQNGFLLDEDGDTLHLQLCPHAEGMAKDKISNPNQVETFKSWGESALKSL